MSSSMIIPFVRPTAHSVARPTARPVVRSTPDATGPAGVRHRRSVDAARDRTPLRLTGRGQLVVRLAGMVLTGGLLVLAVLLGVLLGGGSADGGEQSRPLPVVRHVVAPGETLWQVAGRVAPEEDPRDVVLRIVEANGLTGANVVAGTRLVVPLSR